MTRPETDFNWLIYRDATLAGLAVLIPVPVLDTFFEQFFRRRMPRSIARTRGLKLPVASARQLNRQGCSPVALLLFPLWIIFWLLKRLSKKILYFLTVKDAADSLNYYWHRAFLLDYMIRAGHLDDRIQAQRAERALSRTLAEVGESPLTTLARQVVHQSRHVVRSIFLVLRRGRETAELQSDRSAMAQTWSRFQSHLEDVAAHYQRTFDRLAQAATESA